MDRDSHPRSRNSLIDSVVACVKDFDLQVVERHARRLDLEMSMNGRSVDDDKDDDGDINPTYSVRTFVGVGETYLAVRIGADVTNPPTRTFVDSIATWNMKDPHSFDDATIRAFVAYFALPRALAIALSESAALSLGVGGDSSLPTFDIEQRLVEHFLDTSKKRSFTRN